MPEQKSSPDLRKCANPDCEQKFHRLGTGCLTVAHLSDPEAWGLPTHVKQKAVWLCEKCSARYLVRLDQKAHTIHLVHKHRGHAA
jgi:hypothetical protein